MRSSEKPYDCSADAKSCPTTGVARFRSMSKYTTQEDCDGAYFEWERRMMWLLYIKDPRLRI